MQNTSKALSAKTIKILEKKTYETNIVTLDLARFLGHDTKNTGNNKNNRSVGLE